MEKPDLEARTDRYAKIAIVILIICTFLVSFLIHYVNSVQNNVAANTSITIGNIIDEDIEDLPFDTAVAKVNKLTDEYLNNTINISDGSKAVIAKLKDIGVTLNTTHVLDNVKSSLYSPYIVDSISKHIGYQKKIHIVEDVRIDESKLNSFIEISLKYIEKQAQDASLSINKESGQLEIKEEALGRTLDRQKLKDDIVRAVKDYKLYIKIPTTDVTPKLTSDNMKDLMPKDLMATFSSNYGGSDWGRKENVKLGAALINNTLLKPGEEFEFWKYVGNPTAARGFKLAGIFLNNKPALGIGGGLCQVSTTLYNAALLADLKITERSPHSLPIGYVPLGLDATVAYGGHTLKFVNNTDKYILIKSSTNGIIITFSIYGTWPDGKTVKVYTKSAGYKAADSYRAVYMNGNQVGQDYLGRSRYR